MSDAIPDLDEVLDEAEAAYAEMLAGPEWPADVRSALGPGDPELEAAEAELEADGRR